MICCEEKKILVMQVCWRKPKISILSIWIQWLAVIFRADFIYRLLWDLYVMQTYISLLILLLVNHALQVLNNNGADHLWHLAVGDGSFVLWSDFTCTTSKAEVSLSRKGLKDDFTDFSSKIVHYKWPWEITLLVHWTELKRFCIISFLSLQKHAIVITVKSH